MYERVRTSNEQGFMKSEFSLFTQTKIQTSCLLKKNLLSSKTPCHFFSDYIYIFAFNKIHLWYSGGAILPISSQHLDNVTLQYAHTVLKMAAKTGVQCVESIKSTDICPYIE